ncbi:MAG TPA: leader peptide processing enzyme [Sphaerochaeta sp.]|nr:leader peptide processing enzyme [Sphaerochaeta sp.]
MSKRRYTVLFMIGATLVNILLMLVVFFICLILINLFVSPESQAAPILFALTFLVSIAGSFFLYSRLLKWATNRFDLENKLVPLFGRNRKRK